jgi:hypothetical protein
VGFFSFQKRKENHKMQVKRMNKTFPLGCLIMTLNAKQAIPIPDMSKALNRHASCDWGDVCQEDWNTNN